MRILILNWRDINNPSSGGAEILTHILFGFNIKDTLVGLKLFRRKVVKK